MKRFTGIIVAVLFLSTVTLGADLKPPQRNISWASANWVIPTSANVGGAYGAYFKTKITIFNPTTLSYKINVKFCNSSGVAGSVDIPIAAGESKTWDNFLQEVFGLTGAGGLIFDSWFEVFGGSSDNEYIIISEVYTDSANGKYKTVVPALGALDEVGYDNKPYSLGITVSADTRTNIGVFNDNSSAELVYADLYSSSGSLLKTFTFNLVGYGWAQQAVDVLVSNGYIRWRTDILLCPYAVSVDNKSNDGSLNPAIDYML